MTTFHVVAGHEDEIQQTITHAWAAYQIDKMVENQPFILVRGKEADGKTYFTEIFTWVSHSAPDHAPGSVTKLWQQMESMCEPRGGQRRIFFSKVNIVLLKP